MNKKGCSAQVQGISREKAAVGSLQQSKFVTALYTTIEIGGQTICMLALCTCTTSEACCITQTSQPRKLAARPLYMPFCN